MKIFQRHGKKAFHVRIPRRTGCEIRGALEYCVEFHEALPLIMGAVEGAHKSLEIVPERRNAFQITDVGLVLVSTEAELSLTKTARELHALIERRSGQSREQSGIARNEPRIQNALEREIDHVRGIRVETEDESCDNDKSVPLYFPEGRNKFHVRVLNFS